MLMNTDSNHFLSRGELIEASRISPDLYALNFNDPQVGLPEQPKFSPGQTHNAKRLSAAGERRRRPPLHGRRRRRRQDQLRGVRGHDEGRLRRQLCPQHLQEGHELTW